MSASISITSDLDAFEMPNICILNAPIRIVSLLKLSGGVVGVGDGYCVASGRMLDEVGDDSTQAVDTVIRSRIENTVKAF
jgi:hypothetical protein